MGIKYFQRESIDGSMVSIEGVSSNSRKEEWGETRQPSAHVTITRPKETPNFDNGNKWGAGGEYSDRNNMFDDETLPGSTELFTHKPATIHAAYIDHSLGLSAGPVVLGHAMNRLQSWGGTPMVDPSLSKHSAPLAQRAAKLGLVQPSPRNMEMSQTNNIGHEGKGKFENTVGSAVYGEMLSGGDRWKELSSEEVGAAKQTVRSLAKPADQPQQHMGPQFEQLRLL